MQGLVQQGVDLPLPQGGLLDVPVRLSQTRIRAGFAGELLRPRRSEGFQRLPGDHAVLAARLLHEAEMERTNTVLMERLEKLADSWIAIAGLLNERERV